jgi:hypothetical membrane protein
MAMKATLLAAGVGAVAVYVVGDLVSGLHYDGYSFVDQAISELSAFGSPVRAPMVTAILVHDLLVVAFGVGILRVVDRTSMRWVGGLLVAIGASGLPTHTVWPMSSRDREPAFNDTMHIVLSIVFSLLLVAAMVTAARAWRGWFRLFTLAALAVIVGFGAAASVAIEGLEQNDTPGAGLLERVNAYTYFAWLTVLTFTLVRRTPEPALRRNVTPGGGAASFRVCDSRSSVPTDPPAGCSPARRSTRATTSSPSPGGPAAFPTFPAGSTSSAATSSTRRRSSGR